MFTLRVKKKLSKNSNNLKSVSVWELFIQIIIMLCFISDNFAKKKLNNPFHWGNSLNPSKAQI